MVYCWYYMLLYFVNFDFGVNCCCDLVYEDYFVLLGMGVY